MSHSIPRGINVALSPALDASVRFSAINIPLGQIKLLTLESLVPRVPLTKTF